MAWLDDHPPARDQFRCPRREKPSGVMVVHTAENTPDFVAFDGGAEAVANFIRGRSTPGSYHDLVDSDSCINLVSYSCEAYQDGTGSNRHAWGGSVATRADVWPLAPKAWRDGAIRQLAAAAARYARWLKVHHGVTVPARRINRAQSEARMPGFISHAERDPARRSDPGDGFPWQQFLDTYARFMGAEEDDMFSDNDRKLLTETEDRTQRDLTLLRDNFLDPSAHPKGRANAKTLVIGALKHGLTPVDEGESSDDGQGILIGPFTDLMNAVLNARLGPAEPPAPSVPPAG